jgi:hypothetical protein
MSDQKERLIEEHDMTEEEAEEVYTTMKTQVMLMAQTADRDWDTDEYEAVTDVLMGIRNQQVELMEQMQNSRLSTLARYLPVVLFIGGIAELSAFIWFINTGGSVGGLAASLLGFVLMLAAASLLS